MNINKSSVSFWTILKQTLTEQGKGSSKRVIAYALTGLVCFIVAHASIKDTQVDSTVMSELLLGIGGLLGISAWQQQKGVTNPTLNTPEPTVNPDVPVTPKQPG